MVVSTVINCKMKKGFFDESPRLNSAKNKWTYLKCGLVSLTNTPQKFGRGSTTVLGCIIHFSGVNAGRLNAMESFLLQITMLNTVKYQSQAMLMELNRC